MKGLTASGMFLPGQTFMVTASPGDRLQFATMFVQSNDLFFAPRDGGIALFDTGGRAMHGKVTTRVALFDAGTEVNQPPGSGRDQAPRQAGPDNRSGRADAARSGAEPARRLRVSARRGRDRGGDRAGWVIARRRYN